MTGMGATPSTGLIAGLRGEAERDVPLGPLTTYRIGGPARILVHAAGPEDVALALAFGAQAGLPWLALGLGSNVLVPDGGFPGLVIRMGKGVDAVSIDGAVWRVGAGLPSPQLARRTARAGLFGAHRFVGVPGTVGGGVYMNAGCHGSEFADIVRSVIVVEPGGAHRVVPRESIPFTYRSSGLGDVVVAEVELEFREEDPQNLLREQQALLGWRKRGTPFDQPCCGSVFRNPSPGLTAGRVIDECGLKGLRIGDAAVSTKHANYIVNVGHATADDVLRVIGEVRSRVYDERAIELVLEVKVLGGAES